MTKGEHIRLKNTMLVGNLISNFIGVGLVTFLLSRPASGLSPEAWEYLGRLGWIFDPVAFIFVIFLIWLYERPIRRFMNLQFSHMPSTPELERRARQKMLNEPYFLITMNLCLWLNAAIFYSTVLFIFGQGIHQISGGFLRSLFTGLITTIVAFFVLQYLKQKWLAPYFFPRGGLYRTPRTLRIRIGTRLVAMLCACNIVPFIGVLFMLHHIPRAGGDLSQILDRLNSTLTSDIFIFMGMGIWVTILVARNLTRPFQSIVDVLREVQHGNFDKKVQVTTNDEIGYTGDVINEMTAGLKERDFINEAFGKYVAKEVRDEILSGRIPLNGERAEATLLFSDLRNFTAYVEETSPEEVIMSMRAYFTKLQRAVRRHQGLVLQFVGYEIEAVFGVPLRYPDHSDKAVLAALEMRRSLEALNKDRAKKDMPPFRHGIGIHTGAVLAGNVGSEDRLSYNLIGDTVNVASRIQDLTKEFHCDILVSEETVKRLGSSYLMKKQLPHKVKGYSKPITVFKVL